MNSMTRGIKNAFRNPLRTFAVVIILAIGIGLSLSMLVAQQAIGDRITQLSANLGSSITVNPAGARGFEGGGETLTSASIAKIKAVDHVSSVSSSLSLRLRNSSDTASAQGPGGSTQTNTGTTSLNSAIDAGTLGRRNSGTDTETGTVQRAFSLPVTAVGVSAGVDESGNALTLTSGRNITEADSGANVAVVGSGLATKNSLNVGSTFTAYDKTFTVIGIFNASNTFTNGQMYIPLLTAQTLSAQTDQYSSIIAKVDSLENVDATVASLKSVLGATADVTSSQQNAQTAIDSLTSVRNVSLIGFFASLIAAGVIIFLIMLVVVRERRREIGVLKAIGAGNGSILRQFMVEALVLIVLGSAVGVGVAYTASGPIAQSLVSSNTSNTSTSQTNTTGRRGFGGAGLGNVQNSQDLVGKVATSIGLPVLLEGLGAALLIAIIGSAIPAWMTAKVRPAEVMRGE
ncbi:MAG: ABC transporter permease [Candidatus Saccharimonadales bacterium]